MKKIPENFIPSITHPFKIFLKKRGKKYYIVVEKLSILYDHYSDKEILIENIGKEIETIIPTSSVQYVILTINYDQKGNRMTSASISIMDYLPVEVYTQDTPTTRTLIKTFTGLGSLFYRNADPNSLILIQNVFENLTKYGCAARVGWL
jgi:hypothetical protein